MDREQAERILKPIWLGFAAALERAEVVLEEIRQAPLSVERLRREADAQEAVDYLKVRARAFQGAGLLVAVDTGRAIYTWPNILPSSEAPSLAIAKWREARQAGDPTSNIQPLRREA